MTHSSNCDPFFLVSSAAVFRVVTQRFSPTSGGEALRDDSNNGCGGDYIFPGVTLFSQFDPLRKILPIFLSVTHFPSLTHFYKRDSFSQCDPFFQV